MTFGSAHRVRPPDNEVSSMPTHVHGVNAIKTFDYQVTVSRDLLFKHSDRKGSSARARLNWPSLVPKSALVANGPSN